MADFPWKLLRPMLSATFKPALRTHHLDKRRITSKEVAAVLFKGTHMLHRACTPVLLTLDQGIAHLVVTELWEDVLHLTRPRTSLHMSTLGLDSVYFVKA